MKQKGFNFILTVFLILGIQELLCAQELTPKSVEGIKKEVSEIFAKSVEAGEKLDLIKISENVNDTPRAGFIDNGSYYKSFEELMSEFKSGTQGLENQKMKVETKKITILSDNYALLTAHGDYSAKLTDGRILDGTFAWTFVYSKLNGNWKVIHSHMSNAR